MPVFGDKDVQGGKASSSLGTYAHPTTRLVEKRGREPVPLSVGKQDAQFYCGKRSWRGACRWDPPWWCQPVRLVWPWGTRLPAGQLCARWQLQGREGKSPGGFPGRRIFRDQTVVAPRGGEALFGTGRAGAAMPCPSSFAAWLQEGPHGLSSPALKHQGKAGGFHLNSV